MSTTTRPSSARWLGCCALAVVGWLAIAALAAATPAYTGALVAFAPTTSLEALLTSGDARLIDASRGVVRVEGGRDAALRLYRAGAWLVLPGRGGGCSVRS